jgi:hypothetical protein
LAWIFKTIYFKNRLNPTMEEKMESYGMRGDMNPQTKQKADMTPSNNMKKSGKEGYGHGAHDMSPKQKKADEEAVWQNMRG